MSSWWLWWVVGVGGVAILSGLRWVLADFLLDRFGSTRWTEYSHRPPPGLERAEADVSRASGPGGE